MPAEAGIKFGQYVLLRRIARGGMAEVFLAQQRGLEGFDRRVAVKRILSHLADSPDFVKMFLGEAKLAAQLGHPNIVHIYEFGKVDEDYFIAMEYVEGIHAGHLFKQGEGGDRMPPTLIARIGADAANALHHAHELRGLGLVHRDVSPANIMVSFDGVVKLCDFGIAKAAALGDQLTNPGQVKGKYAYMSPEQTVAQPLDGRSDVFSLCIVLWELLSGKFIVPRGDAVAAMRALRDGRIEPIAKVAPRVPKQLAEAITWGLETRREARATATELAQAFEAFIKSSPELATAMQLGGWVQQNFTRESMADAAKEAPPQGTVASPPTGPRRQDVAEVDISTEMTRIKPMKELEGLDSSDVAASISAQQGVVTAQPFAAPAPSALTAQPFPATRFATDGPTHPIDTSAPPRGDDTIPRSVPLMKDATRLAPSSGQPPRSTPPNDSRTSGDRHRPPSDARAPDSRAPQPIDRLDAPMHAIDDAEPTIADEIDDADEPTLHVGERRFPDPEMDDEATIARPNTLLAPPGPRPSDVALPNAGPTMPSGRAITSMPGPVGATTGPSQRLRMDDPYARQRAAPILARRIRVAASIAGLVGLAALSFAIALAAAGHHQAAAPPGPIARDAGAIAAPRPDAAIATTAPSDANTDAYLQVSTTPPGATVIIGDQAQLSPAELVVTSGTISVSIELTGYETETRVLTIAPAEHQQLELALRKHPKKRR